MVVNPGLPLPHQRNMWKWLFLIFVFAGVFFLVFLGIFFRWYFLHEQFIAKESATNYTALNISLSSMDSSMNSRVSSKLSSMQATSKPSINSEAVLSSFINSLANHYSTLPSSIVSTSSLISSTSTTFPDLSYTTYRMKIPTKFLDCDPRTIYNQSCTTNQSCINQTTPDKSQCIHISLSCLYSNLPNKTQCISINQTCLDSNLTNKFNKTVCSNTNKTFCILRAPDTCSITAMTCCGTLGTYGPINLKYNQTYYTEYLHNCDFSPVCNPNYNSGKTLKNAVAACVSGRCTVVNKF